MLNTILVASIFLLYFESLSFTHCPLSDQTSAFFIELVVIKLINFVYVIRINIFWILMWKLQGLKISNFQIGLAKRKKYKMIELSSLNSYNKWCSTHHLLYYFYHNKKYKNKVFWCKFIKISIQLYYQWKFKLINLVHQSVLNHINWITFKSKF